MRGLTLSAAGKMLIVHYFSTEAHFRTYETIHLNRFTSVVKVCVEGAAAHEAEPVRSEPPGPSPPVTTGPIPTRLLLCFFLQAAL